MAGINVEALPAALIGGGPVSLSFAAVCDESGGLLVIKGGFRGSGIQFLCSDLFALVGSGGFFGGGISWSVERSGLAWFGGRLDLSR